MLHFNNNFAEIVKNIDTKELTKLISKILLIFRLSIFQEYISILKKQEVLQKFFLT